MFLRYTCIPKMKFVAQGNKKYTLNLEIELQLEIYVELHPKTMINEPHLDILKIYMHTKKDVSHSRCSKVIP